MACPPGATPLRAPDDDAPHGFTAWRSSAFRAGRPDRRLTPVDYFRHRLPIAAPRKPSR
jgi:hypothetical protein